MFRSRHYLTTLLIVLSALSILVAGCSPQGTTSQPSTTSSTAFTSTVKSLSSGLDSGTKFYPAQDAVVPAPKLTFSWGTVAGADSYEIKILENGVEVASKTALTTTSYTVNNLESDASYTWSIRAVSRGIPSDWVTTAFTTAAAAGSPKTSATSTSAATTPTPDSENGDTTYSSTLSGIAPDKGLPGDSLSVVINGNNLAGTVLSGVSFGDSIAVSEIMLNTDGTKITATIQIADSAKIGRRDVTVTTPINSALLPNAFNVVSTLTPTSTSTATPGATPTTTTTTPTTTTTTTTPTTTTTTTTSSGGGGGGGGGGTDKVKPTVKSVIPANGATEVAVNSALTVQFSESMKSSTLTTASFTLVNGDQAVPGKVTYGSTTRTATFTPTANLDYETIYTAMLTTTVADAAGNTLASAYSWNFTTAAQAGGPQIQSVSPSAAAQNAAVDTSVRVKFVANISPSTLTKDSFVVKKGNQIVEGQISYYDDTYTAKFEPATQLDYSTTYTAKVTKAITDPKGNPLASDYSWSFTTVAEGEGCLVSIGGPSTVATGDTLDITIDVSAVTELHSWQLWLSYDKNVLQVDGNEGSKDAVSKGQLGATVLPSDLLMWAFSPVGKPGKMGLVNTFLTSVSGSGYLVKIHFKVIGAAGKSSSLVFSDIKFFDIHENQIAVVVNNGSVSVTAP
jgi:hypothetical protein